MSNLPRGITLVNWKNTTKSKDKQIKYRIRIVRKVNGQPYKIDKLFNTLEEAKTFLSNCNSSIAMNTINKLTQEEDLKAKEYQEFLSTPPLKFYINNYVKDYIETKDKSTQLKRRNIASQKSFYEIIKRTWIKDRHSKSPVATILNGGGILGRQAGLMDITKKALGDFNPLNISYIEINDYIKERLKTVSKISVSRELSFIKKLFDNLKHQDKKFFDFNNPVPLHDKSLLVNRDPKNSYMLTKEDKKILFQALDDYPNKQLKDICLLSYFSGFRRSEIVMLEWSSVNLDENYILLNQTKSGSPRTVFLCKESKEILQNIEKIPNQSRLFSYTLMGFSGSFDKFLDNLQAKGHCKGFRFHFFRRECISNLVFNISQKTGTDGSSYSILISEILGIENVRALEKNHLSKIPLQDVNSQQKIMKSIGHSNLQTTKRYSHLKK